MVSTPIVNDINNEKAIFKDMQAIDDIDCVKFRGLDIILRGSFKIVFYDKDVLSSDDIMCWCWLHSAISARQKYIKILRDDIDGAVKDKDYKHFCENFSLEFWFDTPVDETKETENIIGAQPNLNDWISNPSTSFRGVKNMNNLNNWSNMNNMNNINNNNNNMMMNNNQSKPTIKIRPKHQQHSSWNMDSNNSSIGRLAPNNGPPQAPPHHGRKRSNNNVRFSTNAPLNIVGKPNLRNAYSGPNTTTVFGKHKSLPSNTSELGGFGTNNNNGGFERGDRHTHGSRHNSNPNIPTYGQLYDNNNNGGGGNNNNMHNRQFSNNSMNQNYNNNHSRHTSRNNMGFRQNNNKFNNSNNKFNSSNNKFNNNNNKFNNINNQYSNNNNGSNNYNNNNRNQYNNQSSNSQYNQQNNNYGGNNVGYNNNNNYQNNNQNNYNNNNGGFNNNNQYNNQYNNHI